MIIFLKFFKIQKMKTKDRVQRPLIVSERDDSWPQVLIPFSEIKTRKVTSQVQALSQDGIKFLRKLVRVSFIQYKAFIFYSKQISLA